MSVPSNASLAKVTVAGHDYPAVFERNCRTCTSQYRELIEVEAAGGRTWAKIASSLPDDAHLTARNLADHWKHGHVPLHEATVQALIDRQAVHRGEVLAPAVNALASHVEFASGLIGRVRERVALGELEPDIRDALRAAEFVARYQPEEPANERMYSEAFSVYHELAQQVMTKEQFQQFGDLLEEDPTLRRLEEEWRRQRDAS